MIGGEMSNQDEDEVEDEIEELERQVTGLVKLPDAPTSGLDADAERDRAQRAKERARARAGERERVPLEA